VYRAGSGMPVAWYTLIPQEVSSSLLKGLS
jgi:hypothetical protein